METKVAKSVASGVHKIKKDVMGTRNAYFAEYRPKEEREREREEFMQDRKPVIRLDKNGLPIQAGPITADDESSGVVLHRSGKLREAWEKFASESPIGQALNNYSRKMEESDNPLLYVFKQYIFLPPL